MEKQLQVLFEFQRFMRENSLSEVIRETEARYGPAGPIPLSDDWLEGVAAAGEPINNSRAQPEGSFPNDKRKNRKNPV